MCIRDRSAALGYWNKGKYAAEQMVISTQFSQRSSYSLVPIPSYAVSKVFPNDSGGACDVLMKSFKIALSPEDLRRIVNVRFYYTASGSL